MKKVLFAIAVAFVATMSQAAYVSWKVTNADYSEKTIMGFNAADMASVIAILDKGGDSLASDLAKYTQGSGVANKRGVAAGTATNTDGNLFFIAFADEIKEGTTYSLTGSLDASKSTYVPPASTPGTFNADATAFVKSGTIGAGGDTPGGVPEPTSGPLLVLGGAALALRRKQK